MLIGERMHPVQDGGRGKAKEYSAAPFFFFFLAGGACNLSLAWVLKKRKLFNIQRARVDNFKSPVIANN